MPNVSRLTSVVANPSKPKTWRDKFLNTTEVHPFIDGLEKAAMTAFFSIILLALFFKAVGVSSRNDDESGFSLADTLGLIAILILFPSYITIYRTQKAFISERASKKLAGTKHADETTILQTSRPTKTLANIRTAIAWQANFEGFDGFGGPYLVQAGITVSILTSILRLYYTSLVPGPQAAESLLSAYRKEYDSAVSQLPHLTEANPANFNHAYKTYKKELRKYTHCLPRKEKKETLLNNAQLNAMREFVAAYELVEAYHALQNYNNHWARIPFKLLRFFFTATFNVHSTFKFLFPFIEGAAVHGIAVGSFYLYLQNDFESSPVQTLINNWYLLLIASCAAQCQSRFNWHFDRFIIHLRDIRTLPINSKLRSSAHALESFYDFLFNMNFPLPIKPLISGAFFTDIFQLVIPIRVGLYISFLGKAVVNALFGWLAGTHLPILIPYTAFATEAPSEGTEELMGYILGGIFTFLIGSAAIVQSLAKWDPVFLGEYARYEILPQQGNWLATNKHDGWLRFTTSHFFKRASSSITDHFKRIARKCSNIKETSSQTIALRDAMDANNRWEMPHSFANDDTSQFVEMEAHKINLHLGRIPGFSLVKTADAGQIKDLKAHTVNKTSTVSDLIETIEVQKLYFIIDPEANETYFVPGQFADDFINNKLDDFLNQQLLVGSIERCAFAYLKELLAGIDFPLIKLDSGFRLDC